MVISFLQNVSLFDLNLGLFALNVNINVIRENSVKFSLIILLNII